MISSPVKLLVKRDIVDKLCDKRGDVLAFPLRSHVTNTVNGSESESAVVLKESGEVTVSGPCSPILGELPVLIPEPSASAKGSNSSIGIARVVHDSVAICVAKHHVIDPDGGLTEGTVSRVHWVVAIGKGRNVIRNVELLSYILSLKISSHEILEC
jgi:hypothetical protein